MGTWTNKLRLSYDSVTFIWNMHTTVFCEIYSDKDNKIKLNKTKMKLNIYKGLYEPI